jgi:hypothetical protein
MIREVNLQFYGPFGWYGDRTIPCIYGNADRFVNAKGGVYLWTVLTPDGDELVNYVGQTRRSFAKRFREHEMLQSTGSYHVYDPDYYVLGQKRLLWGGEYGDDREPEADFDSRFERLKPVASRFMRVLRFHLAPIPEGKTGTLGSEEFRSRVEAGLAHHFYIQDGVVGEFQEGDVEYLKESMLGKQRLRDLRWPPADKTIQVICHAQGKIRCFPSRIDV